MILRVHIYRFIRICTYIMSCICIRKGVYIYICVYRVSNTKVSPNVRIYVFSQMLPGSSSSTTTEMGGQFLSEALRYKCGQQTDSWGDIVKRPAEREPDLGLVLDFQGPAILS